MTFWYLGTIIFLIIGFIVYRAATKSVTPIIPPGSASAVYPILWGYTDELKLWKGGTLLIRDRQLVLLDSQGSETLSEPINDHSSISLKGSIINPQYPTYWDIALSNGRTLRLKARTGSLWVFKSADMNELMIQGFNQAAKVDIVSVDWVASPSATRAIAIFGITVAIIGVALATYSSFNA